MYLYNNNISSVGVEYQSHIAKFTKLISKWCFNNVNPNPTLIPTSTPSVSTSIKIINEDIMNIRNEKFDIITAFLSLLHIGNNMNEKINLYNKIYNLLNINGIFYAEDYVALENWKIINTT